MFSIDYYIANMPIVSQKPVFTLPEPITENHKAKDIDSGTVQGYTVYKEHEGCSNGKGNDDVILEDENFDLPPSMYSRLRWDEPVWTINVTYATSTVDVWGRIIGTDDWVSFYLIFSLKVTKSLSTLNFQTG